jgi:hypothetical protein
MNPAALPEMRWVIDGLLNAAAAETVQPAILSSEVLKLYMLLAIGYIRIATKSL